MSKAKKLLSILLTVALVISCFPVVAFADGAACTGAEDCDAETHNEGCPLCEAPAVVEPLAEVEEPAETETPAEPEEPAETETPAEPEEPAETETPAEPEEPAETEEPEEQEEETIEVVFAVNKEADLSSLHVYDSDGFELEPDVDEATGGRIYGSYHLAPGSYTYLFHDPDGAYKDAEGAFSLTAGQGTVAVALELKETAVVFSASGVFVNPVYEQIISEADIEPVTVDEDVDPFAADYKFASTVHTTVSSVAKEIKPELLARNDQEISFYYRDNGYIANDFASGSGAAANEMCLDVMEKACEHNGVPNEGDYLRWNILGYGWGCSYYQTDTGAYEYLFRYKYMYVTTADEENVLDSVVPSVISSLSLSGKSNYEKIKAIYKYLTDNVTYDHAHLPLGADYPTQFGAYGALVDGTCVCQGYANAFYRLCLYVGVDTRIVTSDDHAWNIAGLDGGYYELDSTWDAGYSESSWRYFLRGSTYWHNSHNNCGGMLGRLYDRYPCENYYNIPSSDYTLSLPAITSQPQSTTVADGTKATFKVSASGSNLSYQWQYRKTSGSAWTNAVASGNKTATLTPNAYYSMNGYQYRCKVSNSEGTVYSNVVTLTVTISTPKITSQPQSTTAADGTKATFKVSASGGNLSYQWQYRKTSGSAWTNAVASGNKTATLTPNAYCSMNGYQYRCRVSNSEGTVYSNIVTLTVIESTPKITSQPQSTTVADGTKATFKVSASGSNLSYQWQYRKTSGSAWTNAVASGNKTATLTPNAYYSMNGYQYRCKVSNSEGTVYSNIVTLTVTISTPKITSQPQSTTAADGTKATFKVSASGGNLSYQWQYRKTSGSAWNNAVASGNKTATLTPNAYYSMNGYQYRCKVSNSEGTVYSNVVTLTVTESTPKITSQPQSTTAAAGTKATFKVSASGGNLSYQWQYRKTSGSAWTNAVASGNKTATLTPNAYYSMNGYQYRCIVSNSEGTVYSNVVTLTVTK